MVLTCKAIATSGCLTWRAGTQLGLHSIRRKIYLPCGRLTAAASSSVPTDRARGTSIKDPRPARVKKNCYSRPTLTRTPPTGLPMGDLSSMSLTIPKQKLMCGSCRCLEIKSHFRSCRLRPTKGAQGSHQTDDG